MFERKSSWMRVLCGAIFIALLLAIAPEPGVGLADTRDRFEMPVLTVSPAHQATGVRPDAVITWGFDTKAPEYQKLAKRLSRGHFTVVVVADKAGASSEPVLDGKAGLTLDFVTGDASYDPEVARISFRPHRNLNRYTTYAAILRVGERKSDVHLGEVEMEEKGVLEVEHGIVRSAGGDFLDIFGLGRVVIDESTKVRGPTLIRPGDRVNVRIHHGVALSVKVEEPGKELVTVFTTGSALFEPTRVDVRTADPSPRVTEQALLEIVATDDYGLPARDAGISVATSERGKRLPASAAVTVGAVPGPSESQAAGGGPVVATLVAADREAEEVDLNVEVAGPYKDSHDRHFFTKTLTFRPGAPSRVAMTLPTETVAGKEITVGGHVYDEYDNDGEDGTEVEISAPGWAPAAALTSGGSFLARVSAPTKRGVAAVTARAAGGAASASSSGEIRVRPDAPVKAALSLSAASLKAGGSDSVTVRARFEDQYGNPVDGVPAAFSSSSPGAVFTPARVVSDSEGVATSRLTTGSAADIDVKVTAAGGALATSTSEQGIPPVKATSPVASLPDPIRVSFAINNGFRSWTWPGIKFVSPARMRAQIAVRFAGGTYTSTTFRLTPDSGSQWYQPIQASGVIDLNQGWTYWFEGIGSNDQGVSYWEATITPLELLP